MTEHTETASFLPELLSCMLATAPFLSSGLMHVKGHCAHTVPWCLLSRQKTSGLAPHHLPGKDSATATWERVGVLLPEHMSHTATWNDL